MGTIVTVLILLLASVIVTTVVIRYLLRRSRRSAGRRVSDWPGSRSRKLTPDERHSVERYLITVNRNQPQDGLHSGAPIRHLRLPAKNVYVYLTQQAAITCYALSHESPQQKRYYIDNNEIHLPANGERYIAEQNSLEVIQTTAMPLIIRLNGHVLLPKTETGAQGSETISVQKSASTAAIREDQFTENIGKRRESAEEYRLRRHHSYGAVILLNATLLLLFFSQLAPGNLMFWLMLAALATTLSAVAIFWFHAVSGGIKDIFHLQGTLKRWELFGVSGRENAASLSLGNIDLHYPKHWQPFLSQCPEKVTDIEIYQDHHVVRQGTLLSIGNEVRLFPPHPWRQYRLLAIGALTTLLLLIFFVPLTIPLKLTVAWLDGSRNVQINDVETLEKSSLEVGDQLILSGNGRCSVPSAYPVKQLSSYSPFDCSAIYWNTIAPPPFLISETVKRSMALLETTARQLQTKNRDEVNLTPQLATAVQVSGMVLLDDVGDLIVKTQQLCQEKQQCLRLKSALVNLNNAKNWESLARKANKGSLNRMNVLLRPVSAEALRNLVESATSSFLFSETQHAAHALSAYPPGGFLIYNDEGKSLVTATSPAIPVFAYPATEQYQALQKQAQSLLAVPFSASGVITSITIDDNGTRHIMLHNRPDKVILIRHLTTTILLLLTLLLTIICTILALRGFYHHRRRKRAIHHYYQTHLPALSTTEISQWLCKDCAA
ncbi:MAG: Intracellular growth attenuator protein igaA [Candidatus Erwinia impunctatus]|nr:Intracellular growth attenuator protein igaA [Culicoides impunctatus]